MCLELEANLNTDKTNPPNDDVKQARAFERLMALAYLNQCDNSAETTRTMLKTQYVQDHDEYPSNITVSANLVKVAKKESRPGRGSHAALTLAQRSARSTYSPFAERPCLLCGAPDHWQRECPRNVHNGGDLQSVAMVSVDRIISLVQDTSIALSNSLILLDSCSTCSIFKNRNLLLNVDHYSTKGHSSGITIVSNGGSMACSQVSKLPGLTFPDCYHPDSIVNIVSLAEMVLERCITMDLDVENALLLHAHGGRILWFVTCGGGLYTHDLNNKDHCIKPILTLTQTVAQLESQFTKREVKQTQAACDLQRHLGYLSQRTLEHLLESHYYPNCPVTPDDILRSITNMAHFPNCFKGRPSVLPQPLFPAPLLSTSLLIS